MINPIDFQSWEHAKWVPVQACIINSTESQLNMHNIANNSWFI